MCAEKITDTKLAVLSEMHDKGRTKRQSTFETALAELKQQAGPATTRISESILEALGGADKVGKMIGEDIKRVRGDDLTPELQAIHAVDTKSLTRLYDIVLRVVSKRDDLVQGVKDPLDGMSMDDLLSLTAEAATVRIEADPEFRLTILRQIQDRFPEDLDTVFLEAAGVIPRPGVEVIG